MRNNFSTVKLSSVAKIVMGQSPPGTTYNEVGEGLPFYQGVVDFGARYPSRRVSCTAPSRIAEAGDVLFSVRAPIGRVNIATERCCVGRGLSIIKPNDPNDRVFIEFVLRAMPSMWDVFEGGGSVFGNARKEDLQSLEIVWPQKGEREAIASILGALVDKIELNRQMNKSLESMAQAVFKNWFVDFEPFLDQGMQDSPIGPIPIGWEVLKASQAIAVNPSRRLERAIDAKYIDMSSLPTSSARVTKVTTRAYTGSGSRFQQGDTLFARITPCLENGKTAIVDFLKDGEVGWGSTEFIVLGPKQPIGMYYIYCLARNPDFRAHAIQAMSGTSGRQRVDSKCFDYYYLAIPPQEIMRKFQETVRPWFEMLKTNDEESQTLATIRDALLPKLLSGELRIEDTNKFTEEAA